MAFTKINSTPAAPDTLPDDFADWDESGSGGNSAPASTAPVQSARPAPPPAPPRSAPAPAPPRPVARVAEPVAPVPQRRAPEPQPAPKAKQAPPVERQPAPPAKARVAEKRLAEVTDSDEDETKPRGNKGVLFAVIGVVVLGGAGAGAYFLHPWARTPQHPQTTTTITTPAAPGQGAETSAANAAGNAAATPGKPSPGTPANGTAPTAADAENTEPATPTRNVDMSQFSGPSHITHDNQGGPEPTGFDANGLGSGSGPMISGGNKNNVHFVPAGPVKISSGVSSGMLVRKTIPQYPEVARAAHVSGTVVVAATITSTGSITNAHAISGPPMLRQAAVDAVSAWHYRPYMLDNKPVPVETTINVDFKMQ